MILDMCPDCHHTLAAKDLIPVLSWLSLGGRCRYCRKPISWQYPLVEVLTGALFALSYLAWPLGFHGGRFVGRRMINARASLKQLSNRRLPLDGREPASIVDL